MQSAQAASIILLGTGACIGPRHPLWAAPTVIIAVAALVVSLLGLGFSVYSWFWTVHRRLVLDQTGDSTTDVIFEGQHGTTYKLTAVVIHASKTTTVVIREFRVKLPWHDDFFELLDDPRLLVPPRDRYKFPGTQMEHARTDVINHWRNAEGVLPPGGTLEGLLLAYSPGSVPQDYRQQGEVRVEVGISDETGKSYRHAFTMRMNLARKQAAQL
jgi:hypothetical protein